MASKGAHHSRARKQVWCGLNYFLEVELGRTTGTKSHAHLAACDYPFHDPPQLKKRTSCSFHIHTAPWMGFISW